MKKSILVLAACNLAAIAMFTNCSNPAEKVEKSQTEVVEAEEDLVQAQQDYLMEVENYRAHTAQLITANNESIREYSSGIELEKEELRADYRNKIAALERKNRDMSRKLDDYKADGKDQWQTFKAEFNRDMDQLGRELRDLNVRNN
jgi:hypothetical protein